MKKTLSAITAAAAFLAASSQSFGQIWLIDAGRSDNQTAITGWNNFTGPTAGPNDLTNMVDSLNNATTLGLSYAESGADSGVAGSGADWGGAYPAALSGTPTTALADGLFIGAADVTLTLTGLDSNLTYDFLFYGARGNNGSPATFEVTGDAAMQSGSISNVFQNETETVTITDITPNGSDEIVIFIPNAGGGNAALNYLQITAVPEPSTFALLAGSLALTSVMIRRRRS